MKKLTVPENVKKIGDAAFCNCTALKTVKISEGTQKIGNYCFVGCESLSELTLPQKIDEIGEYAFFGCSGLEKIDLPKSFKRFGGYALEGTKWMTNQKSEFVVVGDGLLLKYNGNSDKIIIPDKVKIIGECAFAKNEKIKDVHRLVDDLERALVTGSTPFLSLTEYLTKKCAELDKKYPRTRPLIVKRFNASITIYSGSPEKAQIESGHTAISFMVSPPLPESP